MRFSLLTTIALTLSSLGVAGSAVDTYAAEPDRPVRTTDGPPSPGLPNVHVGGNGAVSQTIPIPAKAARGPTPSLALVYNSLRGNGPAGVGWHLAGLPAIVRVPGPNGMRFESSPPDRFAYSAEGLGEYPDPNNELVFVAKPQPNRYHLAVNQAGRFLEFEAAGSCGAGPCYWRMRDGSGSTYYFGGDEGAPNGSDPSALWEPMNGAEVQAPAEARGIIAYGLRKVRDADGNFYTVRYVNAGYTLEPVEVDYALPLHSGGAARFLRLKLTWETRPDPTPPPFRWDRRLRQVESLVNCTAAACTLDSLIQLEYQTSPANGRSLLWKAESFGTQGTTAPALELMKFGYSDAGNPPQPPMVEGGQFLVPTGENEPTQFLHGDIDRDGRLDMIAVHFSESYGTAIDFTCGQPDGYSGPIHYYNHAFPQFPAQPDYRAAVADFDGDGYDDLLAMVADPTGVLVPDAPPGTRAVFGWIAFGGAECHLSAPVDLRTNFISDNDISDELDYWVLLVGDYNGDGRADPAFFARRQAAVENDFGCGSLPAARSSLSSIT